MTTVNHILLIEDDDAFRAQVAYHLSMDGHQVTQASDGDEALELLRSQGFQLVITDLRLPGPDGLEITSYIEENLPGTPVIVMSAYGSVNSAVQAIRSGAYDFQVKPINMEHLRLSVERALRKAVLHHAFDYLRHEQPYIYRMEHIVAHSPAMRKVLEQASRVAATDVTVLLTGETGTGKSLVAGAIHANSPRRDNTIVTVNCAALTETLLESELFGHEKGAFTGAHKTRNGRIRQAHGGSLFLDEVGDMSMAIQAKMLRAIEDKVIQPVGSSRAIQVDVRIIAATNVELRQALDQGRFREDLYYRLTVTPIHIPPLRQRPEDIIPLAERFLARLAAESKRPPKHFSPGAVKNLTDYHWPGNIRELRNVVERAVLFANGPEIDSPDLGLLAPASSGPMPEMGEDLNLYSLEHRAIVTALERTGWVQNKAADLLGISPRALSYKLNKFAIKRPS